MRLLLIKTYLQKNGLVISCLLLTFLILHVQTNGQLLSTDTHFGNHQAYNAWKIYQIEKENLNPFFYDIKLEDLSGGRFVSYWDTPLPYSIALILARILTPLGSSRFLIAIKLTSLINLALSYLALYWLLRKLKVSQTIASAIPVAILTHRFISYTFSAINLLGIWALVLPIGQTIKLGSKGRHSWKEHAVLGLFLAGSALQNPYYALFSLIIITPPLIVKALTQFKQWKTLLPQYLLIAICALLPVLLIKGPDLYQIYRRKIPDPEDRNYITKQAYAYRPWFHLIPPEGNPFTPYIVPHVENLNQYLIDNKILDRITVWHHESHNTAYLGIVNLLLAAGLVGYTAFTWKKRPIRLKTAIPYLLGWLAGGAICFRGDIFINSKHHIVFPWYRLQVALPLVQLRYYSLVTTIAMYSLIAILLHRAKFKHQAIKTGLLTLWLILGIIDTSAKIPVSKIAALEGEFISYLHQNPDVNRLYFEPELRHDGRYYQIYHQTKIYAPHSLSWFDFNRYDPPLVDVRNWAAILTDAHQKELLELGVEELVLINPNNQTEWYWNMHLSKDYTSKKKVLFFDHAIVFAVSDN